MMYSIKLLQKAYVIYKQFKFYNTNAYTKH